MLQTRRPGGHDKESLPELGASHHQVLQGQGAQLHLLVLLYLNSTELVRKKYTVSTPLEMRVRHEYASAAPGYHPKRILRNPPAGRLYIVTKHLNQ